MAGNLQARSSTATRLTVYLARPITGLSPARDTAAGAVLASSLFFAACHDHPTSSFIAGATFALL